MRAFVLQGRAPQIVLGINPKTMPNYKSVADLKGKKIGVTAPGSSTNVMANFVLAKAGLKPSDVSYHRRGRRQRRGRGDALGPDRRDQQPRPGDHAAAAFGRPEDRLRHARRGRGRQGLRRADAGRLPVRAADFPRQEPGHRAGAGQRDRARRQVDPGGRRRATSSRPCPRPTCSATARSTSTPSWRPRVRCRPTACSPRRARDGVPRAGQRRRQDRRRQARPEGGLHERLREEGQRQVPKREPRRDRPGAGAGRRRLHLRQPGRSEPALHRGQRRHAARSAPASSSRGRPDRLRQEHAAQRRRRPARAEHGHGAGVRRSRWRASTRAPATCSRPRA